MSVCSSKYLLTVATIYRPLCSSGCVVKVLLQTRVMSNQMWSACDELACTLFSVCLYSVCACVCVCVCVCVINLYVWHTHHVYAYIFRVLVYIYIPPLYYTSLLSLYNSGN